MGVSIFTQPDYTSQTGSAYKANLDAAAQVHQGLAGLFAAHQETVAAMTVRVDAGRIFGHNAGLTEVAAQSTATITAPSGNPRYDIVHIDRLTGAVGVATGSENVSPSDPAVPAGKVPVARVRLATSTTAITNSLIDDLRVPGPVFEPSAGGAITPTLTDRVVLGDASASYVQGYATVADVLALAEAADQVARDMAMAALIAATSTGGTRGPVVSFVADSDNFATKTNATFDTDHYANTGGNATLDRTTGTNIGSMSGDGGLAAAYDGTTSQAIAACATVTATTGTIGKDYGVGNAHRFYSFAITASTDVGFISGSNPTVTLSVYGTTDGGLTGGTLLGQDVNTDSNGVTRTINSTDTVTGYRGYYVTISDGSSTKKAIAEIAVVEVLDPTDMTLIPTAATLDAADPDVVDVYVSEDEVDADPTRTIEVSIDNGSTYATATLEDSWTSGARQLHRYTADTSGQTGSTMKVRYKTNADALEREVYRLDAVPLYA